MVAEPGDRQSKSRLDTVAGAATADNATTVALDRRRHAYRDDLASEALRGRVKAARYVTGQRRQVMRSAVPLRATPSPTAMLDNEVLFGEVVDVFDDRDGWAWCQLTRDGYVGYLPSDTLSTECIVPTHRLSVLGTFVYSEPDIKSAPLLLLSINALLNLVEVDQRFSRLALGGFVVTRHVSPVSKSASDFVEVAEQLIGTPYLWGGRTRLGLDCSALIQLAMEAGGMICPRDSDMQRNEIGQAIDLPADLEGLQRGDLVFWKGHVGVMTDGVMLLHANAHHMATFAEPLSYAADRILKAGGGPILAVKRAQARTTGTS
jgi:Bacterial dipeptidyl-peptidase Sh3 domain/NlpC/P60 family